ncbi:MAG: GNAT family N-acetyltransferase [Burkholderiaceae bacterium]
MTIASGRKVRLRRAVLADRPRAYAWLVDSDLARATMGQPLFPDHPAPTYEQFCDDYEPHFFEGSRPLDGRGLIVQADGADIGFLAYRRIDLPRDVVELDVWLAGLRHCGRGRGSEALMLACEWLQQNFGVNRFVARPSRRNVRALRAVRRAGFRETDLPAGEVIAQLALPKPRYFDEVPLFRVLPPPAALLEPTGDRTYVFVDSEFTSLAEPRLISIGAVATDSAAFYRELSDWRPEHCSEFVRAEVLPQLEGGAVPHPVAADAFAHWIAERAEAAPVTIVSDSGFDRWALADLLGREDLPADADWRHVPIDAERLDDGARALGLRRHHALDDARALRYALLGPLR